MSESDRLVQEQIRYYEDRAPEYEDLWFRRGALDLGPGGNAAWFAETSAVEEAVDAFDASGTVLEIACGSGILTRRLAPRASRLVAVDTSSAMLERNRSRFGRPTVEFVQADVFEWEPGERFDAIVMGAFISHVPPDRFDRFWERLRSWLAPDGEVFLVDELPLPGAVPPEERVEGGPWYAHRRWLADGREYTVVKIFYEPNHLAAELNALGWDADLWTSRERFYFGTVRPRS